MPGGAPGPKKPEELLEDPKAALNPAIVEEMGAKETPFDPQAKDADNAVKK